jgi:hypothetical protein
VRTVCERERVHLVLKVCKVCIARCGFDTNEKWPRLVITEPYRSDFAGRAAVKLIPYRFLLFVLERNAYPTCVCECAVLMPVGMSGDATETDR